MKVGDKCVYAYKSAAHADWMDEYIGAPCEIELIEGISIKVRFTNGDYCFLHHEDLKLDAPELNMTTTTEEQQNIWEPQYDKYAVIDFETTVNAPDIYKFRGSAAYNGNKAVAMGLKVYNRPDIETAHVAEGALRRSLECPTDTLIVGHNIKFDLQYAYKSTRSWTSSPVWDTSVAHYMMTGQTKKMPSLNEVAEFYGLGAKTDEVKDLWDMGVKTEDIEVDVLIPYLRQDVHLTERVYLAQQKRLEDMPWLRDHILRVSSSSCFLGACETNGLPIDGGKLYMQSNVVKHEMDEAKLNLYKYAEERYKIVSDRDLWDPTTPSNLGKLLFDLPITIEDYEPAGRILKSGKVASRRRKLEFKYDPPADPLHLKLTALPIPKTASGAIQTSEELLDTMEAIRPELVGYIKTYRGMSKLHGTYMVPTQDFYSAAKKLHPSFHITTTNTGRSSSSGPNAQQIPPELEKCILPNMATQYLVKADFKQLQMCGAAMLSGDKQLTEDINFGRDVHYETGKMVFGWKKPEDMTKEDRRIVKNVNFGLLFGGKAAGLAKQTGVDKKVAQQCIDAFYERYPRVKEWVDTNIHMVEAIAVPAEGEFINGDQVREAFLKTPAGRILRFVEHEVPAWVARKTGRGIGFSPNEIANYPVQAYCDGDIALTYLAILSTTPGDRHYTPINFVHDSVWVLTSDVEKCKVQLQSALDELNDKMKLSVPLKLDFTVENYNGDKVG